MKQKAIEIDKVKLESRKNVTSVHMPAAYRCVHPASIYLPACLLV